MASTYTLKGRGYSLAYNAPGFAVLTQEINIPNFADPKSPDKVVDSSGNDVTLSSGFGAGDKLEAFFLPAGTLARCAGFNVKTAEGGTATLDMGDSDNADGWLDGINLNSVAAGITLHADDYGVDNVMGKIYTADTKIVLTFVNATDAAIFDIFMEVCKVF